MSMLAWLRERVKKLSWRVGLALILTVVVFVSVFAVVGTGWLRIGNKGKVVSSGQNHFSVRWMGFSPTDYSNEYPEYYICVNNLADNILQMQIALEIKNQENMTLYFKVDQYESPPNGWTINAMAVGPVNVDETKQFVYDGAFRVRPTSIPEGRLTETINLVIQAYYDSGYTNFYSQDNFTVTFNFLDLNSPTWTVLYHDDFDDGTTQGWSYILNRYPSSPKGGDASIEVSDTYYRSFHYSLKLHTWTYATQYSEWASAAFSKSFDIGLPTEAYLIFSIRSDDWSAFDDYGIKINGVTYFKSDVIPEVNTWYQFAIPLRLGEKNTVEIWVTYLQGNDKHAYSYLDDVYVIGK